MTKDQKAKYLYSLILDTYEYDKESIYISDKHNGRYYIEIEKYRLYFGYDIGGKNIRLVITCPYTSGIIDFYLRDKKLYPAFDKVLNGLLNRRRDLDPFDDFYSKSISERREQRLKKLLEE